MKVGDLVRHEMYASHMPAAVVLSILQDKHRDWYIQVLGKGDVYWDRMCDYEVISESR